MERADVPDGEPRTFSDSFMTRDQIERELASLEIVLSVDQRKKNPLVKRYIQKLRILLAKIRELQKEHP